MVRRVDRNGKAMLWSRKCSGYARCCLGPKLMNRSNTEKLETNEHGKMLKRICELDEGRVPERKEEEWVTGKVVEGGKGSWRFHGAERFVEHCQKKNAGRQRSYAYKEEIIHDHA